MRTEDMRAHVLKRAGEIGVSVAESCEGDVPPYNTSRDEGPTPYDDAWLLVMQELDGFPPNFAELAALFRHTAYWTARVSLDPTTEVPPFEWKNPSW